jgi:Na+/proline symporter
VTTAVFIGTTQLGPMPIGFMYMNEVTNYKAISTALAMNWLLLICLGIFTKPLFESVVLGKYVFIMFGCINSVALLIVVLFMKETKGLSEA